MQRPRFNYELKHYNGKFLHDLAWLPVEVHRAFSAMIAFALALLIYRTSRAIAAWSSASR
jgi:hypothetical protein